jgi:hypothetical protein
MHCSQRRKIFNKLSVGLWFTEFCRLAASGCKIGSSNLRMFALNFVIQSNILFHPSPGSGLLIVISHYTPLRGCHFCCAFSLFKSGGVEIGPLVRNLICSQILKGSKTSVGCSFKLKKVRIAHLSLKDTYIQMRKKSFQV